MDQAPTKEGDLCPYDGVPVDVVPLPFTSATVLYCHVCGNTWPIRGHGPSTIEPEEPER